MLDVLNGERDEIELYRSTDELEYLKKSYEELYNIYLEDVYGDETFKSDYGDDDFVKTLLMDVLSVLHFHKDESIYFDSDSEVNKYLHDLVMNETSLNRK